MSIYTYFYGYPAGILASRCGCIISTAFFGPSGSGNTLLNFLRSGDFVFILLGSAGNCIVTFLEFYSSGLIFTYLLIILILICVGLHSLDTWVVVQLPSKNPLHQVDLNLKKCVQR